MGVSTSFYTSQIREKTFLDKIIPDSAVFKQNNAGTVKTPFDVSYCLCDKYCEPKIDPVVEYTLSTNRFNDPLIGPL